MLRWRLFGISFCIQPSFWLMNALWAYLMYAYPHIQQDPNNLPSPLTGAFLAIALIWIFCTLVAVMVHELGHVITGRIFGQAGSITLSGLGGQAVGGYEALSAWKRILVIAAGPGAGFLFVAALAAVDGRFWNLCMDWMVANAGGLFWENFQCKWFLIEWIKPDWRWGESPIYTQVMFILLIINLFMNIMNLLPIIPMDGGMIFKEICCLISPKSGLKFAFICSFVLALILTLYLLVVVLDEYKWITKPPGFYYPFGFPIISLLIFGSLAYQSYQAYRQLSMMERHSMYREYDD